jgi:serine/threonine protein kinase
MGPYEVLASVGAGGRGEVYSATDTKLGRDTALDLALSAALRNGALCRQAKAFVQLDHPNIVMIHSVEEFERIHLQPE